MNRLSDPRSDKFLGHEKQSWIVSVMPITNLVLVIPSGIMADRFGRKTTLILSFVPTMTSWLILVFDSGFMGMMISRCIAGIGFAMTVTVGPVYLSEIAQDRIRGRMGTMFLVMFNAGILFENSVATYLNEIHLLVTVSAIIPLIFCLTFNFMPESPFYLIHTNRAASEQVLFKLRRVKDKRIIRNEMDRIDRSFLERKIGRRLCLPCKVAVMKPLSFGLALIAFQQLSGVTAVISYARVITRLGEVGPIVIGSSQLCTSCFVPLMVDHWGRRPLLMASYSLSAIFMFASGWFFYKPPQDLWIGDITLVCFMVSQVVGSATLPMTIIAELMPSEHRANALGISQLFMALMVFIVTKSFLYCVDNFGTHVVFFGFSINCLIALTFVIIFLPETKRKAFVDIQNEMRKPLFTWKKQRENSEEVVDT